MSEADSIYILVANEDEVVKECFAVRSRDDARRYFETLKAIYGGANVCMASRRIDDVPLNIAHANFDKEVEKAKPNNYIYGWRWA